MNDFKKASGRTACGPARADNLGLKKPAHFTSVAPMKFCCCLALLLALVAGCQKTVSPAPPAPATNAAAAPSIPGWPPTNAQPRLQVLPLFIHGRVVDAEVALREIEIGTGMMFRKSLGTNEGMLFVLFRPQQARFYMKNTLVPLQIAYIDPAGVILELHELKPLDETSINSEATNIQFVLEMNTGWFTRNNLGTGAVIRTQLGPLPNAFVPASRNGAANPP